MKDKLWFYATYKYEDNKTYVASSRFADGSPAFRQAMGNYSGVGRLTWQATSKDKVRFYIEKQFNGEFYNGFNTLPTTTPEASTDAWGRGWIPQVRWTEATSNKLLLEAGLAYYTQPYEQNYRPTVGPRDLAHLEQTTGLLSVAAGNTIPPYTSWTKTYSSMASATYITGSHAVKAGMTLGWGTNSRTFSSNAQINTLVFNGGAPIAVAVSNGPVTAQQKVRDDLGTYVQDTWTHRKLTLNLGARFDHFNAYVPAESAPAAIWVVARSFPEIDNVPNWNDWSVRVGGAYDVFGTGKTAIKANVSKYIAAQAAGYAANFNGMSYATQTRAWLDLDRNGSIFDSNGNIQFNEVLGGTSNFGGLTVRPDPSLARGYNWEYSGSVQHEILPRISVTVGYYHRKFYNLQVADNQNLTLSDWTPFSINTPTDTRLAQSGQPIALYNLSPTKVGVATDNLLTYSTQNSTVYNGFEIAGNMRREKLLLFGGVTIERRVSSECDGSSSTGNSSTGLSSARDNPNALRFCDSIVPGSGTFGVFRATAKASAAYMFPYDIQLSGSFLAAPGSNVSAYYTITSAIAGRTVIASTAGANTMPVNLIQPNTMFLDYRKQLDMRIGKTFRIDRYRIQGFADIFNVLNAGTVTRVNETYGANPATNAWLTPTAILDGRYVRFGMQMSF